MGLIRTFIPSFRLEAFSKRNIFCEVMERIVLISFAILGLLGKIKNQNSNV